MPSEHALKILRSVLREINLQSKSIQREYGITSAQLILLREAQASSAKTTTSIARKLGINQSTATLILDKLEDKGLIERIRDKVDKRRWLITLTEAGISLLEKAPLPLHYEFKNRFTHLPKWQQAQIIYVLELVLSMFNIANSDENEPIILIDENIEEDL